MNMKNIKNMFSGKYVVPVMGLVVMVVVVAIISLSISYNWCPYGQSLQITRKTGRTAETGRYAGADEQGVQEQMLGPGRHFLNPWTYSAKKVSDKVIPPRHIGLVKNNIGKDLPSERFIAESDEKGTQREVLTPGVWRINDYGQVVDVQEATVIEPGYVGVQTLREGTGKGILPTVLQAGYYNINPAEIRVDPVEIGYRVWEARTEEVPTTVTIKGVSRQVMGIKEGTGVPFPLADGKQMHLDFTVVWGIFPEDAPRIIREYGTVEMVEEKIIEPQILSICKNAGSNLTTQEFIEGTTREEFQGKVTEALQAMGKLKGIHFLIALVRGFHPDEDIKATIQAKMIAEEEKITLKTEQKRETVAASLEEAERMVDVAIKDFDAETETIVQKEIELGNKKAAEIKAETDQKVAELDKQAADIDAQIVTILGQAEASVIEAINKAEATKLELLIEAYGGAESYNLATFAESLPENLQIEYRYAGQGTLWTDAKASLVGMAARKTLSAPPKKPAPKGTAGVLTTPRRTPTRTAPPRRP